MAEPARSREEIHQRVARLRPELARLGVRSLALFGSAARGAAASRQRPRPPGRVRRPGPVRPVHGPRAALEETLERPVDLVTTGALKPAFGPGSSRTCCVSRDAALYLADMAESCRLILDYTRGMTALQFRADRRRSMPWSATSRSSARRSNICRPARRPASGRGLEEDCRLSGRTDPRLLRHRSGRCLGRGGQQGRARFRHCGGPRGQPPHPHPRWVSTKLGIRPISMATTDAEAREVPDPANGPPARRSPNGGGPRATASFGLQHVIHGVKARGLARNPCGGVQSGSGERRVIGHPADDL